MENKKGCYNCDNSMHMGWNDDWCKYAKNNSCSIMKEHKHFILRRDKRSCENCDNSGRPIHEYPCYCCTQKHKSFGNSGYNYHDAWKPRKEKSKQEDNVEKNCDTCDYDYDKSWVELFCGSQVGDCRSLNKWKLRRDYNQENKEQEMSYKPTSSCTLKNIADKINETGCSEAKAEWFDVNYEAHKKTFNTNIDEDPTGLDEWIPILTKTEKRINWLKKFGYIEEEISLKPCPFCGGKPNMVDGYKNYAVGCETCNHSFDYRNNKQEAIKAWNTRK